MTIISHQAEPQIMIGTQEEEKFDLLQLCWKRKEPEYLMGLVLGFIIME